MLLIPQMLMLFLQKRFNDLDSKQLQRKLYSNDIIFQRHDTDIYGNISLFHFHKLLPLTTCQCRVHVCVTNSLVVSHARIGFSHKKKNHLDQGN
jgi:hypothetical protein